MHYKFITATVPCQASMIVLAGAVAMDGHLQELSHLVPLQHHVIVEVIFAEYGCYDSCLVWRQTKRLWIEPLLFCSLQRQERLQILESIACVFRL